MKHPGKKQSHQKPESNSTDDRDLFLEFIERLDAKEVLKEKGELAPAAQSKRTPKKGPIELDLHGKTLVEAQTAIDQKFNQVLSATSANIRIRVITGKGRHSGPGGWVLAREIHDYVRRQYNELIQSIDPSPADSLINGLPLRGFFDVELRKKK